MSVPLPRVQGLIGNINPGDGIPKDPDDVTNMISTVISTAYVFAAIAAVGFIIYSGFLMMLSAGDPQKLKKGQDTLVYSVIGLVIIILSALILNFIAGLFGIEDAISTLSLPFL